MDHWTHKVIRCYYLTCDVSSCWIIHFVAIYSDLCRIVCSLLFLLWMLNNGAAGVGQGRSHLEDRWSLRTTNHEALGPDLEICEWHRVTIIDNLWHHCFEYLWTSWTFISWFCQTNWPQIEIKHPPPSANCLAERVGASMFSCVFGAWLWDSRTSFQAGYSRLTAVSHCTPCCSPIIYYIYNYICTSTGNI